MEEDDDDFSFGDFTSASNLPNLPPISTTQHDDQWGEFVKTPFGSTNNNNKPDLDSGPGSGQSTGSKAPFQNLKGPLPLSLFGDVEEETESEDLVGKCGDTKVSPTTSSSKSNKTGFNDIIAHLYEFNNNYTNTSDLNINNDDDRSGGKSDSNVNKEIVGENGSSFDFYRKGLDLDSKDPVLERKSFDVVNKSDQNGDQEGGNSGSVNSLRSNFSGWGLESRDNSGSIKRSSTNVDENAVRGLDFSGWGMESRENSGSIKRSSTNVDENAVRGLDFSGWGMELRENTGSIKRSSTNVDENVVGGFDFSGWGLESRENNGSIKRSSTNVDANAVRGLDFSGWGLESKESNGSIKRSSTNVDENAVQGFDFSGSGLESRENNSMQSLANESKQGKVENDGFSYDSNRSVSSANASTSNTNDFGFDFGGWGLGSNGGSTGSGMLNTGADINGLTGAGVTGSNSNNTRLDENGQGDDIGDEEEDEDDGWEFKGASSENKGSHGIDITFNSNYSSNGCSPNKGVSLASKNEDYGSYSNGTKRDENNGREFQVTFPEENASHIIDKVGPSTREPSNTSTHSTGFSNGSSNAVKLFAMSDGLNNLFPMGDGVSMESSNLAQKSNSLAAPINFTPDNLFRSEPSECKAQLSSSDITIEDAETDDDDDDDDFGDFTTAFSVTGPKRETDSKVNDMCASGTDAMISTSLDQVNGGQHLDQNSQLDASISSSDIGSSRVLDFFSMSNGSTDLFSMVNAINGSSLELQTDHDTLSSNAADMSGIGPTHEGSAQESNRDGFNPHSVPESDEIEDDFGDFAAAFPGAGQEGMKASDPIQSDNEESAGKDLGTGSATGNNTGALPLSLFGDEESEVDTNILKTYSHSVSQRSGQSPKSAMSINDLISNLYSQAEQSSTNKFVGATDYEAGPAININSEPVLDDYDFNEDSWEFKDSFGNEGTSKESLEVAACSIPSKVTVNGYVDFYSKLQDTLNFLIKCHLENIKKDGDSGKVMAVDEEIQDELEHVQETIVTKEDGFEGQTTTDASLRDFIEALKDPKLQMLEAEYDLSIKLSSICYAVRCASKQATEPSVFHFSREFSICLHVFLLYGYGVMLTKNKDIYSVF
ncbi:hypothetical protein Leryth_020898 [Lithospermum erythrorhizon]|nr:hypothetical protein Leryth_020898 [Lithospermum erythrorhizon]